MPFRKVIDQMGRLVEIPSAPKRIVSLVPSQTELLYDLGLSEQIVGQTLFCIHPAEAFKTAHKIGGTKKLRLDKIRALKPDLIIGNKEENEREQIETLAAEFPVWMSDIIDTENALQMVEMLGDITGKTNKAIEISQELRAIYHRLQEEVTRSKKTLYLIWKDPWMAAGNKTYIHHMLAMCGFENCLDGRYPELTDDELKSIDPEVILLSSEPYPFQEKHLIQLKSQLPKAEIKLVDGEFFSWYGSRLIHLKNLRF